MKAARAFSEAVFARDLKVAFRSGGGWFYALFFFAVFAVLAAIAIGPGSSTLVAAAPAVLWLAAAFALQFSAADIFEGDIRDGALRALSAEQASLFPYWLAKVVLLGAIAAAPIAVAAPFVLTMLGVAFEVSLKTIILTAIGFPALILVAVLTAALASGLRAGGLLAMIIAAPFSMPVLVFGVSATNMLFASGVLWSPETLILSALSLFMAAVTPAFAIATLRLSLE